MLDRRLDILELNHQCPLNVDHLFIPFFCLIKTLNGCDVKPKQTNFPRIRGKRAVLTIFEDGVKKEDVQLYELKTRAQMHELMQKKGFRRKTPEEKMESIKAERVEEQIKRFESFSAGSSFFGGMVTVYGIVLSVVVGMLWQTSDV